MSMAPEEVLTDLFFSPEVSWTAARRIEVRRGYASDTADPRWSWWARGGRLLPAPHRPWSVRIRQLRHEGRNVERVRVVDAPATTGQRYLRWLAPYNLEAGERIRLLGRAQADELALVEEDVWLFEGPDPKIATLRFDAADVLTGVKVSSVTEEVSTVRSRWAAVWLAAHDLLGSSASG
jgi:hypothetical protein